MLNESTIPLLERLFAHFRFGIYLPGRQMAAFAMHESHIDAAGPLFGHCSYDLKNRLENLQSANPDHVGFPDLGAFAPQVLLDTATGAVTGTVPDLMAIGGDREVDVMEPLHCRVSEQEYQRRFQTIQKRLQNGDIYEITYCIEHTGTMHFYRPVAWYNRMAASAAAPHSVLYKWDDSWAFSLSPERFLMWDRDRIMSQPIKGTAPRSADTAEDARLAETLVNSEKERAENVMITDLVRNDLSRIALPGSVQVDELCGLYSFPGVHQLISTISARLQSGVTMGDVLQATFPMGSMTGAPKISAMTIIDALEGFSRNLFSGSVWSHSDAGQVDMNVMIRTLLWNQRTGFATVRTGGAITLLSQPADEYQECLLKAGFFIRELNNGRN
jgi:para-aminobenzoate synthetase component 1